MKNKFPIQARTATGLEKLLAKELTALGAEEIKLQRQSVTCRGDLRLLYQANLWCRAATRVLRPVATFPARDEKELYNGIRNIRWRDWLLPQGSLAIDAHVWSSFTTHSLYVAQLAKDAIVDQFRESTGKRPLVDRDQPDLRISLNLISETAEVSVDSSGESLHKRGYRHRAGLAPLSEALAAAVVRLSGWDGNVALLDPFCGSATLLIEAGLQLRKIAPGLFRQRFGFQKWPDFDRSLFEALLKEAKAAIRPNEFAPMVGFEVDPKMAEIARENVARAGLKDLIRIENRDFFNFEPDTPSPGLLLMNPPYDERLAVDNVAELYQRIGDRLKTTYPGWTAWFLSGNLEAIKYIGLRSSQRLVLFNGGLECRLLQFEMRREPSAARGPRAREGIIKPVWQEKAQVLANRLRKNFNHFSRWTLREKVSCWRVYDRDVPELPFIVDIYGDRLHFAELERNHDHSPIEHKGYMQLMVQTAASALNIPLEKVYFKKRKPQKSGTFQYSPTAEAKEFIQVTEHNHRFLVNLADYLDVGLFLDHRKTRVQIEKEACGKDFLNLFGYTGSFTVYAASGEAKSTTTVDTNRTYLEWAEKNVRLNGFTGPQHKFIRSDTFEFLEKTRARFDLCVVDPPTRSVNRSSGRSFQVQTDHVRLLKAVVKCMRPGASIFFSTNYRTFELDEVGLRKDAPLSIKEITRQTLSPDFQRKPSHRCWRLDKSTG